MNIQKVSLSEKFSLFTDYWHPRIAAELNGQQVKLVKLKGDFIWHQHEKEDELFLVVKGVLNMEFREKTIQIREGEFLVVPRGVDHRPSASEEAHILLFEPAGTLNTGNIENELTRPGLQKI